jgi:hypothetical protein
LGFTCVVCGQFHEERPLDIRLGLPDDVFVISEPHREERAEIAGDFCRLDGERHFVRGVIQIPIPELKTYFGYGVWIETSEADWWRLAKTWNAPVPGQSVLGRLANELNTYPGSLNLRVSLTTRDELPAVQIDDDHQLATEQRDGIPEARANVLSASVLH